MSLSQFVVRVYNHVLRRAYDLVIEATDANQAWSKAEFILGWPNLDDRTYVVRVRPI